MTPEEKAVIDAAIAWHYALLDARAKPVTLSPNCRLKEVVVDLICSCPQCRTGGHTCPGCGEPIGHTRGACADCEILAPLEISGDEVWPAPGEWLPATLLFALAGDRIRIGEEEAEVFESSSGIWHVNTANYWHPTPWKHTEVRLDLTANPGFQQYPPNTPCEIWCTPERRAVLLLQQAFPGTEVQS